MPSTRTLAAGQGSYYVATGVWSIAHRASFERVTGPKRDYWLVRTVGGLAIAIGTVLAAGAVRDRGAGTTALAVASGVAFGAADLQAARASSRIYLADAALHALLLAAWIARRRTRS